MKIIYFIMSIPVYFSITACSNQKYTVDTVGYSSWEGSKMVVRRKAILLNTDTGETWGLAYNSGTPTRDGFAWQKLPRQNNDSLSNRHDQASQICDGEKQ